MAYLAIENDKEIIYELSDDRTQCSGNCATKYNFIELPSGSIEKLIGKKLRPGQMPVELNKY